MSKKIIIIITLAISFLSVILIAMYGTLPESGDKISLQQLTISNENYDLINEEGEKLKNVTKIITEDTLIYQIKYELTPVNATTNITAKSNINGVNVRVDEYSNSVYVTFDLNTLGKTTTITITDNSSNRSDRLILWFEKSNQSDIE